MKQSRTNPTSAVVTGSGSMTAFFEYLDQKPASTELAKALSHIVMLRTCGAASGRAA
jgi:hypothetical protein